ncbi:MAG TPA: hypothetical protein VGL19_21085 [Polyangiaceae bacterium]|jgi:hypothetical protein
MKRAIWAIFATLCLACGSSTGSGVADFQAAASGPEGAIAGQTLSFDTSEGWHVELGTAKMHIGAIYLSGDSPSSPSPAAAVSDCILPGDYVAEVVEGRDIDLLSSKPQLFPVLGHGTVGAALSAQVWLTGGDVNDPDDPAQPTVVLQLKGQATHALVQRRFQAALTIANNRVDSQSAIAGSDPLCSERIVSPIPTSLQIETSGSLLLRIDPRRLFNHVDFGALVNQNEDGSYAFTDSREATDPPSVALYGNLKATGPLYRFSWVPGPN